MEKRPCGRGLLLFIPLTSFVVSVPHPLAADK